MLTANTKTFLRVRDTRILTGHVAQDNIFKLIHSRVRKHQRGVTLYHHWSGRHDLVFLRSEELPLKDSRISFAVNIIYLYSSR